MVSWSLFRCSILLLAAGSTAFSGAITLQLESRWLFLQVAPHQKHYTESQTLAALHTALQQGEVFLQPSAHLAPQAWLLGGTNLVPPGEIEATNLSRVADLRYFEWIHRPASPGDKTATIALRLPATLTIQLPYLGLQDSHTVADLCAHLPSSPIRLEADPAAFQKAPPSIQTSNGADGFTAALAPSCIQPPQKTITPPPFPIWKAALFSATCVIPLYKFKTRRSPPQATPGTRRKNKPRALSKSV